MSGNKKVSTKKGNKENSAKKNGSAKKNNRGTPKKTKNKNLNSTKKQDSSKKKKKSDEISQEEDEEEGSEEDLEDLLLPGQKHPTPPMGDASRAFYESLLEQKPNSIMALKWCIEYGCLEQQRVKMV